MFDNVMYLLILQLYPPNSKWPVGTLEFTLSYLDNTNTCYHELVAISLKHTNPLEW